MKIKMSHEELRMLMVELEDDKNAIRDVLKFAQDQCHQLENELADARKKAQDHFYLSQKNEGLELKIKSLELKIEDLQANLAAPNFHLQTEIGNLIEACCKTDSKIEAIKAVRALTDMGLKESKDFCEKHGDWNRTRIV